MNIYDIVDEKFILFSAKKINFSRHLVKYQDDVLFDMYDRNQFVIKKNVSLQELINAQNYQINQKRNYFKLISHYQLDKSIKDKLSLEENCILTMLFEGDINYLKTNDKVIIKPISLKDLDYIELKHYEKLYGRQFIKRKNKFYIKESKTNPNFKYYGAYINNKIVGACYGFTYHDYTCLDSLIVDRHNRHKYIASTLLKYVISNSKKFYVHADEDDTPKNMYLNMGFIIVDKNYEYFKKISA